MGARGYLHGPPSNGCYAAGQTTNNKQQWSAPRDTGILGTYAMWKNLSRGMGLLFVFITAVLLAQPPATAPEFEVASIKPAPPIEPQKIVAGTLHVVEADHQDRKSTRLNSSHLGIS